MVPRPIEFCVFIFLEIYLGEYYTICYNIKIRREYMSKILFIGGSQFFGKKAVEKLVARGHQVTLANRGNNPQPLEDQLQHINLDARDGNHPGWELVRKEDWDAVYNNVIYNKEDAYILISKLAGVCQHLYYTSSMAVYYPAEGGFGEEDFKAEEYKINREVEVDYGEGKRQVEAVLFQQAPFKVTAFRFPIVLDFDDHTRRLHFYIEEVLAGRTLYFDQADNRVNYLKGSTAADAIVWAIEHNKEGIYNVSVKDWIDISTFIQWLAEEVGRPVEVVYEEKNSNRSPFNYQSDSYVISDKIIKEGFELPYLEDWLKPLMREISQELRESQESHS